MPREATAAAALTSLRDELRSARRWQELLSERERRQMLADVAAVALALGKDLWPDRPPADLDIGGAAGEPGRDACPRERLAFLEAAWPHVSAALRLVEGAPPPAVAPAVRTTPTERARRVTPAGVLAAAARGDLTETAATTTLARRLGGRIPRRVPERVFLPTFDTPANRAVKAILAQLARDLGAISDVAQASDAPDVAQRASALLRSVRLRHLGVAPWESLPPLPAAAAAVPPLAPSLRAHAGYRALHDTWRRYRQGFAFDWDNPWFTLPARETWRLYETWCLFRVADALRALGWRATRAEGFALARGGLTFSVAPGASVRWTFAGNRGTATLTYARHFRSGGGGGNDSSAGWHSRSHALTPDVTLEHAGSLLIFDAKFKTYAGTEWQTEDIRQMHSYRDAIRRQGAKESGGDVTGAWLLYAGRADGSSRPVIAYPDSTAERPFGNGDVGAILLRPGDDAGAQQLRAFLAGFLDLSPVTRG